MNEEAVGNWIRKAESDLKIGQDEMGTEAPATDAVCFHMQQCGEKYLKAFLIFHGKEVPRTHSIAALDLGADRQQWSSGTSMIEVGATS